MGKKHPRRPLHGRHALTVGALSLLGVSGYELWIRWEDFWAWTAGVRHLSARRGTPFLEDLAIVFEAPEMQQLGYKMGFLGLVIIFALICLLRRNRARGAWFLMVLDLVAAGTGGFLGLYTLHPASWAQVLKLVPMALIFLGCAENIIQRAVRRRRRRKRREAEGEKPEREERSAAA